MVKTYRFKRELLIDFAVKYMEKLGVPAEHATIVANVMIEADTRNVSSHGLIRLNTYYGSRLEKGYMNPKAKLKTISETDTTLLLDGDNGLGHIASYKAMSSCIDKAKKSNVAIATVKHSNHFGIAAYYAMMALKEDMIGISMTNSQPLQAPTYGKSAILGTNPISVAAPSYREYPYVLDMATSVVPIGKIKVYEKKEEKIPLGWGIDDDGNVTDDPKQVQSGGPGALMPLGSTDIMRGYKGYGLALLVEILCSTLSGASTLIEVGFPHEARESDVSHFFMAVKIDAFRPVIDFKKQLDHTITMLKSSPKAEGQDRIYIAGEKEFDAHKFNTEKGVPLIDKVIDDLKKDGERVGVPFDVEPISVE